MRKLITLMAAVCGLGSLVVSPAFATDVLPSGVTSATFGDNTVTDGTTYYATMTAALAGIHLTGATTLYCKPGADVGTMTHGHVCSSLTVYGNGATVSGGEQDFEVDTYTFCHSSSATCDGITGELTLTVKNLNGAGAWGQRTTAHTLNLVFEGCENMSRIFVSGTSGANNITVTNCTFTSNTAGDCKIYSNANGTITVTDCAFSNVNEAINLNHKVAGEQIVTVSGCTFDTVGDSTVDYAAPVRVLSSVDGATSTLTVSDCTFTNTVANSRGQDADILLDYGVGTATASISGTAADVIVEQESNVNSVTQTTDATEEYVLANEDVLTLSGVGTEAEPYLISSKTELANFCTMVNAGNDYSGMFFKLTADIDLSDSEWSPIGNGTRSGNSYTGNVFKGIFDGADYTISGLKITTTADADAALGLFGVVDGGMIKNLTLADVAIDVDASECAGGAVGVLTGEGTVSNITVSGAVSAKRGNGGIVGRMLVSGTIADCVNNAAMTATGGANLGGIVGAAYYTAENKVMTIKDCTNNGTINGAAGGVGGIAGLSSANIENCTNTKDVNANGASVGGIVGEQQNFGTISNCTNNGNVVNTATGAYGTGGIVGWIRYSGTASNYPKKGIVTVTGCTNTGSVTGSNDAGGIVGVAYNAATITENTNVATSLNATSFAAGIVANLQYSETPVQGTSTDSVTIPQNTINVTDNMSATASANITANCTDAYAYDNSSGTQAGSITGNTIPVAQVGENYYATFDEALAAANAMTGDVTVEIYQKVEYTASSPSLSGTPDSIAFVGKTETAEISITRNGSNGYISGPATGRPNVFFTDLILSKPTGDYSGDAGFMNVYFTVYRAGNVSYSNCTFPNGACAASASADDAVNNVTFTECEFTNATSGTYNLWVYANADVTVDNCTFTGARGIKMYTESNTNADASDVVVEDTTFTVTEKPAIELNYGSSITLAGNTYPETGVIGLNATANGTVVEADITDIACVTSGADSGVLVDGKIYSTLTAAVDAGAVTETSSVTLMYDSTETIELPSGVTLNKNGYTAAGVTVATPSVAQIGETAYATFAEALAAAEADQTITLLADVTCTELPKFTKGGVVNVDINGNMFVSSARDRVRPGDANYIKFVSGFGWEVYDDYTSYASCEGDTFRVFPTLDEAIAYEPAELNPARIYPYENVVQDKDVTLRAYSHGTSSTICVDPTYDITWDLNGYTVLQENPTGNPLETYIRGKFTLADSSDAKTGKWIAAACGVTDSSNSWYGNGGPAFIVYGDGGLVLNGGTISIARNDNGDVVNSGGLLRIDGGTMQINDGVTLEVEDAYGIMNWGGDVTVNGGTFNVDTTNHAATIYNYGYYGAASATVNSYFPGMLYTLGTNYGSGATATVNVSNILYYSDGTTTTFVAPTVGSGLQASGFVTTLSGAAAVILDDLTATSYATIADAITDAQNGDEIIFLADVHVTSKDDRVRVSQKNVTLDLNGHKITSDYKHAVVITSNNTDTVVTIKNGTIEAMTPTAEQADTYGMLVYNGADVTLEDVTISKGYYGIQLCSYDHFEYVLTAQESNNYTTLVLNDGASVSSTGGYAICAHGSYPNVAITVNEGATVTGGTVGIYNPAIGSVTINGGTITGATGVYIKSGSLSVTGGTIIGNGEKADYEFGSSGGAPTGDAIVIESVNTSGSNLVLGDISISGGTFISENADAVGSYAGTASNPDAVAVSGFISGGTFSSAVAEEFCAAGYAPVKNSDGTYGVGVLPNAEVSNLGAITVGKGDYADVTSYYVYDLIGGSGLSSATAPFTLSIAMDFTAKDTPEQAAANAFSDYTTDFFITMNGMTQESFSGDGCYLAGYYPSFNAWVKIPLDGFIIEKGMTYPVITSAGFDFSYEAICETVGQFICGIYLTPEVLAANPDMTVDLTLGLSEDFDAAQDAEFTTVDNYVYTADNFAGRVAKIGDVEYKTLQEAIDAAEAGDTIKLIRDITEDEIVTIDKAITLDGNGKTLTSTAGRAINVSGADGVTIKNLTIDCTGERGINIIQGATNVTIDGCTIDANNYAVNVAGSAANAVVTVKNSDLTGLNVVNVGAVGANVTVTDTKITCNDQNEDEIYAALVLNMDAVGATITANGCTFDVKGDSQKARNGAEDGTITIDGSTDGVVTMLAAIEYGDYHASFATLADAIAAAEADDEVIIFNPDAILETEKDLVIATTGANTEKTGKDAAITAKVLGGTFKLNSKGDKLVYDYDLGVQAVTFTANKFVMTIGLTEGDVEISRDFTTDRWVVVSVDDKKVYSCPLTKIGNDFENGPATVELDKDTILGKAPTSGSTTKSISFAIVDEEPKSEESSSN